MPSLVTSTTAVADAATDRSVRDPGVSHWKKQSHSIVSADCSAVSELMAIQRLPAKTRSLIGDWTWSTCRQETPPLFESSVPEALCEHPATSSSP